MSLLRHKVLSSLSSAPSSSSASAVSVGLVAPRDVHLPIRIGPYEVRLAASDADIEIAQRLRYDAFYEENGAQATAEQAFLKRDIDRFDAHCEHLLVFHTDDNGNQEPIGTYRLMTRTGAKATKGFLSAEEYDLTELMAQPDGLLEVSRACITPPHRKTLALQLLWQGMTSYVLQHDIKYLFGCASFHGTDIAPYAETLSYLHSHHRAPPKIRPIALPHRYVDMQIIDPDKINKVKVFKNMPTLLKAYLRLGGLVGDGAVIDPVVRTVDVCIILDVSNIDRRYYDYYTRKFRD